MRTLTSAEYASINRAIQLIQERACARVDISSDLKVYGVKNVIRIDLKVEGV